MKKKIIISALTLSIGAGLVGSITSTAAWYQYSTRTNAAYIGASGGAAGNLNMRIRQDGQTADQGWTTFLSKEQLQTFVEGQGFGTNIQPITPGTLDKNSALPSDDNGLIMYSNPVPGRGDYSLWNRASKANYIVIPLQLRYVEVNDTKENVAKDVYLSELVLNQRTTDPATDDITEALRFHISSYDSSTPATKKSNLVSKKGGTTVTNGKLDLDGDGQNDKVRPSSADKYGFEDDYSNPEEVTYGSGSQVSFTAEELNAPASDREYYDETDTLVPDANVYSLIAKSRDGKNGDDLVDNNLNFDGANSKSIGSTVAGTASYLNVDITIWVEGWQKFPTTSGKSSIWSKKYIDAAFNIGFEFAINAEVDA